MNWTKVGLKVVAQHSLDFAEHRLNWTKVGLKAVIEAGARGNGSGLNWTKVGLKDHLGVPVVAIRRMFELD